MFYQIIDRLNQFTLWAVTTLIIGVVVLIILRMIADVSKLNFFGWTYVTLRRLSDPIIVPVRAALRGFRVDVKYAPLIAILIMILIGWLAVTFIGTLLGTLTGIVSSIERRSIGRLIGHLLYGFLAIYALLIFARVVFSWMMIGYSNRVMRFLINATEPLLAPLRRTIPPLGMFDISAFVAFIIIWVFQAAIAGTLLRG
ncbi:MAG TPA: YggT family protein [Pyrinomonadaceae bacterium]|nr:YggT family protein [Pyrinomonadaceae bacterium]